MLQLRTHCFQLILHKLELHHFLLCFFFIVCHNYITALSISLQQFSFLFFFLLSCLHFFLLFLRFLCFLYLLGLNFFTGFFSFFLFFLNFLLKRHFLPFLSRFLDFLFFFCHFSGLFLYLGFCRRLYVRTDKLCINSRCSLQSMNLNFAR